MLVKLTGMATKLALGIDPEVVFLVDHPQEKGVSMIRGAVLFIKGGGTLEVQESVEEVMELLNGGAGAGQSSDSKRLLASAH